MRRKVGLKRIERLEAFALGLRVEDAKRRHLESLSKMSEEDLASLYFAAEQPSEMSEELFRSGLATTEHLEERVRLGWQRFCETGGHAAVSDFRGATDGKVSPSGTPWDHKVLFEGLKHSK